MPVRLCGPSGHHVGFRWSNIDQDFRVGGNRSHGEYVMFNRRVVLSALAIVGLLAGGEIALAKAHHHHDGHALLGAKLHQNGKHEIGKIGNNTVTAEVNNNKVASMSAGSLPVKKMRSKQKMASVAPQVIQVAATGEFKLAQA